MRDMATLRSSLCDVTIPRSDLTSFVLSHLRKQNGGKHALIDGVSGEVTTFHDLIQGVQRATSALFRFGVRNGSIVCVILHNCSAYPIIVLAVTSLGGVVTALNPAYTSYELNAYIDDCNPSHVITSQGNIALTTACQGRTLITLQDLHTDSENFQEYYYDATTMPTNTHAHCPLPEDIALLLYSSGTTGKPKTAMLTHHNLIANISQHKHPALQLTTSSDVVQISLPFFHAYGLVIALLSSLIDGATIVIQPRFQVTSYLRAIALYKVTVLHLVPPMMSRLCAVEGHDVTSVLKVCCGGAPLNPNIGRTFLKTFKNVKAITQGYGATETSPGTHFTPRPSENSMTSDRTVEKRMSSFGVLLPNTLCKVVDVDTGVLLGAGQAGELWISGPQVMAGYRVDASSLEVRGRGVDEGGWYRTGDIVTVNEDGWFYLVDRLKDTFKCNGFQVSPSELECLLLSHDDVEDAAVIGVPDASRGQIPKAFVVPKPGADAKNIQRFVADHVISYKQLRGGVEFVSSIPRNPSGKILRRLLGRQHKL